MEVRRRDRWRRGKGVRWRRGKGVGWRRGGEEKRLGGREGKGAR